MNTCHRRTAGEKGTEGRGLDEGTRVGESGQEGWSRVRLCNLAAQSAHCQRISSSGKWRGCPTSRDRDVGILTDSTQMTHGLDAWGGRRIAGQNRLVCDRSNDPWQRYNIATLVVRRKYREIFEGCHSRIVCEIRNCLFLPCGRGSRRCAT